MSRMLAREITLNEIHSGTPLRRSSLFESDVKTLGRTTRADKITSHLKELSDAPPVIVPFSVEFEDRASIYDWNVEDAGILEEFEELRAQYPGRIVKSAVEGKSTRSFVSKRLHSKLRCFPAASRCGRARLYAWPKSATVLHLRSIRSPRMGLQSWIPGSSCFRNHPW